MIKIQRDIRKTKLVVLFSVLTLTALTGSAAFEGETYIVETGPEEVDQVFYTWDQSDTTPYYQDATGENPDVGLMICDAERPNPQYAGLVHLMGESSGIEQRLVSYESGNDNLPLADNEVEFEGQECLRTSISNFVISPSSFSDKTPEVFTAAHPSDLYVKLSDDETGEDPSYVDIEGEAEGFYSGSTSYTFDENEIQFDIDTIIAETGQTTETYDVDTDGRGVSSDRPLIVGVCSDSQGNLCETGIDVAESPGEFPVEYGFEISQDDVNDQERYTRYAVANGKQIESLDIGADLEVTDLEVDRDPIFFSQTQGINFEITNEGNVPVTSSFEVQVTITGDEGEEEFNDVITVDDDIQENGGSITRSTEWVAEAQSGDYNLEVLADSNDDLEQINEPADEDLTFELNPVTLPEVRVDGEVKEQDDTEFQEAGNPYNLSLVMENSDDEVIPNASVEIVEEMGMSPFAPVQMENVTGEVEPMTTLTTANPEVGEDGKTSLTVIPTGNILLKEEYDHLDVNDQLNHSIYIQGEEQDGTDFKFVVDDQIADKYPLELENPDSFEVQDRDKDLPNLDSHVEKIMSGVYTVFANFWEVAA